MVVRTIGVAGMSPTRQLTLPTEESGYLIHACYIERSAGMLGASLFRILSGANANLMPTILIVDDSPTIRRMVRGSLGTLPETTFVEAVSGLQAIPKRWR